MKTCVQCKEDFPEDSFGRRSDRHDGLNSRCKVCVRNSTKRREKPVVTEEGIRCRRCGESRPVDAYQSYLRYGVPQRRTICKPCYAASISSARQISLAAEADKLAAHAESRGYQARIAEDERRTEEAWARLRENREAVMR